MNEVMVLEARIKKLEASRDRWRELANNVIESERKCLELLNAIMEEQES